MIRLLLIALLAASCVGCSGGDKEIDYGPRQICGRMNDCLLEYWDMHWDFDRCVVTYSAAIITNDCRQAMMDTPCDEYDVPGSGEPWDPPWEPVCYPDCGEELYLCEGDIWSICAENRFAQYDCKAWCEAEGQELIWVQIL